MNVALRELGSAFPSVDLALLATDLAHGLRDPAEVWHDQGIVSKEDAKRIIAQPIFQKIYQDAKAAWATPGNTRERIRLKALMSLEYGLIDLHAAVVNPAHPLNHRVQAAAFIGKLAGLDAEAAAGGGGGAGVTVNIDLSGSSGEAGIRVYRGGQVVDATPVEAVDDAEEEDDNFDASLIAADSARRSALGDDE